MTLPDKAHLYKAAREVLHWVDSDGWNAYPAKSVWECLVGLPDDEAVEYARKVVREFKDEQLARTHPDVMDLVSQMNRGGVRFTVDGKCREVRFTAHPDPDHPNGEYACLPALEVALMLRSTVEGKP